MESVGELRNSPEDATVFTHRQCVTFVWKLCGQCENVGDWNIV